LPQHQAFLIGSTALLTFITHTTFKTIELILELFTVLYFN